MSDREHVTNPDELPERARLDEAIAELERMRADHSRSWRTAGATLELAADRLRAIRDSQPERDRLAEARPMIKPSLDELQRLLDGADRRPSARTDAYHAELLERLDLDTIRTLISRARDADRYEEAIQGAVVSLEHDDPGAAAKRLRASGCPMPEEEGDE